VAVSVLLLADAGVLAALLVRGTAGRGRAAGVVLREAADGDGTARGGQIAILSWVGRGRSGRGAARNGRARQGGGTAATGVRGPGTHGTTRLGVTGLGFHTQGQQSRYIGGTMDVKLEITGTSPLLMHNISLADPDNPIVREIQTYTGKRKKTEDDRRAIERLEWFGGLYVEDGEIVMPTGNVRRCIVEAGKISRQGTQVVRALQFTEMYVPLSYDGSRDPKELFKQDEYHDRSAVGISGKRTMRVRPKFPRWALVAHAILLESVMDAADLRRVAEMAGKAIGLGDNRINGFGRFSVTVV
jgi:hypothetical protein